MNNKFFLIGLVSLIVTCCLLAFGTISANPIDPCTNTRVPKKVLNLIVRNYSQWHMLKLSDLPEPHQQKWLGSNYATYCPGIASGHFLSSTEASFAFSLLPRNKKTEGYRLVVVSKDRAKEGQYVDTVLDQANEPVNPQIVYTVPPGKYSDQSGTEAVELVLDGIQVEEMEKGAALFFWRDGQYRRLQVSE